MNDLEQIVGDAIAQFAGTGDAAELERVKAGYLGLDLSRDKHDLYL